MALPLTVCSPHLPANGVLRRYVELALSLMTRRKPIAGNALNRILASRTEELRRGHAPHLQVSDTLLDSVSQRWLAAHFPEFSDKRRGVFLSSFDRVAFESSAPGRGECYALALATLYDSTAEALDAVTQAEDLAFRRQREATTYEPPRRAAQPTRICDSHT
ncbi:MAG: hypothetical protein K1X67_14755 [Fimbriimonadaceae bacterium]|nr:hypothetical protein [Fimbriimonadaceae bacterium]